MPQARNVSNRSTTTTTTWSFIKLAAYSAFGFYSYLVYQKYYKRQQLRTEWTHKNITRISDVSLSQILDLFAVALDMEQMVLKKGGCELAKGKLLSTIFYEPSTRTCTSFQAAMLRLGGKVVNISDVGNSSSVSKGESLEDTMRCLASYSDVLVVRHSEKGAPDRVMKACPNVPVLNAGDGSGEHPTQALLDLFTIYKEKGQKLSGLSITFVGDLKYGRTVHSLVPGLALFDDIKLNFVAPPSLQIPDEIVRAVKDRNANITIETFDSLSTPILNATDVMYVTRIQKERFESMDAYRRVKDCFVINNEVLTHCKSDMIIMHPLPRVNEIAVEVDSDERAKYFQQMKYGMYVRMALLALVMGVY